MRSHPLNEGERTLPEEDLQLNLYESEREGEDDPMVSETNSPLSAKVEVVVPSSGAKGVIKALIDSGCIRFLVSLQTDGVASTKAAPVSEV